MGRPAAFAASAGIAAITALLIAGCGRRDTASGAGQTETRAESSSGETGEAPASASAPAGEMAHSGGDAGEPAAPDTPVTKPGAADSAAAGQGQAATGTPWPRTSARDTTPMLPGDAAIDLAMNSNVLGPIKTSRAVDQWLKNYEGDLIVMGWFASLVDPKTDKYIVSYTYAGDAIHKGWFFEVDVPRKTVKNLATDPAAARKYRLMPCPPSENEDVRLGYDKKGSAEAARAADSLTRAKQPPDLPLCVEPS
jgi:hypothetical protein